MTDEHSGWDALFKPEEDFDSNLEPGTLPGTTSIAKLENYLRLPGVRGLIQVTLDGVVLHQNVPSDIQYYSALCASVGSVARQADRILELNGFEYAVVRLGSDAHSTLIFRDGETFIGLLLSGEIAPTHIVTRLRDLRAGRPG